MKTIALWLLVSVTNYSGHLSSTIERFTTRSDCDAAKGELSSAIKETLDSSRVKPVLVCIPATVYSPTPTPTPTTTK